MAKTGKKREVSIEVLEYVRFSLREGISISDIESSLREAGHSESLIAAALDKVLNPSDSASGAGSKSDDDTIQSLHSDGESSEAKHHVPELCVDEVLGKKSKEQLREEAVHLQAKETSSFEVVLVNKPEARQNRPSMESVARDERIRYLMRKVESKKSKKAEMKKKKRDNFVLTLLAAAGIFLFFLIKHKMKK